MNLPYPLLAIPGEPRRKRLAQERDGLASGESWAAADLPGPGVLVRLHVSGDIAHPGLVLRARWDDEQTPSVEAPVWALLGDGPLQTPAVSCAAGGGELRFPMPFVHRAQIELVNVAEAALRGPLGVQADYDVYKPEEMRDVPPTFHASWTRENPAGESGRRLCLLRARGHGSLAGLMVSVRGTEQAREAWAQAPGDCHVVDSLGRVQLLAGLHAGDLFDLLAAEGDGPLRAVRFWPDTPLQFWHSLCSTVGVVAADVSAVAYWYQYEPHGDFLAPLRAADVAEGVQLPPGARDLPAAPQEGIEWLCGDGRQKVVSLLGTVDLRESRRENSGDEEVLWTEFHCPQTRTGQMCVSHDGYVKVLLNGRMVFERDRAGEFGVDPVAVMIPQGKNSVRLETRCGPARPGAPWVLGFRIANSEGRTIEQMDFQEYPTIPVRSPGQGR
jgi:hypothetical protein